MHDCYKRELKIGEDGGVCSDIVHNYDDVYENLLIDLSHDFSTLLTIIYDYQENFKQPIYNIQI